MKLLFTAGIATGVVLSMIPATGAASEWFVVCDKPSGFVLVTESVDGAVQSVMTGPLPGRSTAEIWLDESCPGATCDSEGRCSRAPGGTQSPADDGWVAGEVVSETADAASGSGWVAGEVSSQTLSGSGGSSAVAASPSGPDGPSGPEGPGGDGLRPLIDNARAAVGACNFEAALLTADHMLNFDPEHVWLAANHQRLKDLALRQRSTEGAVWQASSALSAGDLKTARKLAQAAADRSVSCQSRAVSDLLAGIDAAIEHRKKVRAAKNSAAMATLLPGLVDLANTAIAAKYGTTPPSTVSSLYGAAATSGAGVASTYRPPDPCAFKYEYRNVWNPEPSCTCPGYRFDVAQHRCVR